MARALRQGCHRSSQAFVARPAEDSYLALARLYRYRAHPSSCGQSLVCRVALSLVAYVGYQRGGRKRTVGAAEQREEQLTIRVSTHRPCDPLLQMLYPLQKHLLRVATSA